MSAPGPFDELTIELLGVGPQGPPGEVGPQGPAGPPGETPAGTVRAYTWDGTTYVPVTRQVFTGPEDPEAHGFTLADGDQWEATP